MKSYVIADRNEGDDRWLLQRVTALARLGADFVQLRDKEAKPAQQRTVAAALRRVVPTLIINSHLQLATEVGADGVHLPSSLPMPLRPSAQFLLGRSCHTVEECRRAADEGADYVLFGPIFDPRSKSGEASVSLDDLRLAGRLGPKVFALGGVAVDTLPQLADCGVEGVAAITLFLRDEPIDAIMEQIRKL